MSPPQLTKFVLIMHQNVRLELRHHPEDAGPWKGYLSDVPVRGDRIRAHNKGRSNVKLGMTFKQAAKAAGVGEDDIIAAIKAGELVAHLHGSQAIVLKSDLRMWLDDLPTWKPLSFPVVAETSSLRLA